ncbi:MAG: hypothetical protein WDZ69_02065 [Candidatus Pacearchaeota archaeon]
MVSVGNLKREHEEIFRSLLDFEEEINNGEKDPLKLSYHLNKTIDLILYHNQNHKSFLEDFDGEEANNIKNQINKSRINPREIRGHIFVISKAISSNNGGIKTALENDGRMFISKVKEHILNEEMILDKMLFLGVLQSQENRNKIEEIH